MPLARRIAALLLLALWLPAMLHCRLEAAGVTLGDECCGDTHRTAATDGCADDACEIAEGSFTKPSSVATGAPAPMLFACLLGSHLALPPLALSAPPVSGIVETVGPPLEISRTWLFVHRAAPQPRAPSLAS